MIEYYSFFYRLPDKVGWKEFVPNLDPSLEHESERRYIKEILVIVLIGFSLQFILINNLWNFRDSSKLISNDQANLKSILQFILREDFSNFRNSSKSTMKNKERKKEGDRNVNE